MTYGEYKSLTIEKSEHDLFEATVQVAWFKRELRDHKYNSVPDAQEKLKVWQERLDGTKRRRKQLDEMFSIAEEENLDIKNG